MEQADIIRKILALRKSSSPAYGSDARGSFTADETRLMAELGELIKSKSVFLVGIREDGNAACAYLGDPKDIFTSCPKAVHAVNTMMVAHVEGR
jgi:hypothetical protein